MMIDSSDGEQGNLKIPLLLSDEISIREEDFILSQSIKILADALNDSITLDLRADFSTLNLTFDFLFQRTYRYHNW